MSRRLLVLVAVLLTVAAGVAVDRSVERRDVELATAGRGSPSLRRSMPVVPARASVSSSWFCTGGSTVPGGPADAHITVTNTLDDPVRGTLRVVGSEGDPVDVPLSLAPEGRVVVRLGQHVQAPHAGALLELDGGGVVVEQEFIGPQGYAATPCATSASPTWHLAEGTTAKDAAFRLVLLNPFPDDAIADLRFATEQGRAVPADFQGVVVPGGAVRVVDVGSHVRRREAVATTVRTRTGRLVVGKLVTTTAPGRLGLSATPAAPEAADTWLFPEGLKVDGTAERVHVYNPGRREAAVDVALGLEEGALEPFELTVPPGEQVVLDLSAEERVPKGVGHSIVVRSVDGVPIVAERVLESSGPPPRLGRSVMLGARGTAHRWAFSTGGATAQQDEWIVVFNPGRLAAVVRIDVLGGDAVAGLRNLTVPGGRRLAVRLADHLQRADLPLVVTADRAVVVERDIYRIGSPGMTASAGVPALD